MIERRRAGNRRIAAIAAAVLLALVALGPTSAFAQAKGKGKPAAEEETKGYTLPYFFTLIGAMAVVIPVCMACRRKWDIAAEEEEE